MAGQTVAIRVNRSDWEAFKEVAHSLGASRNALINMFISSVLSGKTKIEHKNNININVVNLVPISNTNNAVFINQTKEMKNELILEEIKKTIKDAYDSLNNKYNRNGTIPYPIKEKLKKLVEKATVIPPDLFEEAKKIILT